MWDAFTTEEKLNRAAQNLRPGHMWPMGRGLDIAALEDAKVGKKGKKNSYWSSYLQVKNCICRAFFLE